MTLAMETRSSVEKLMTSGGKLLQSVETMAENSDCLTSAKWSDVADSVRRYLAMLVDGQSADDAKIPLRGANLLTTVNKGIGDAEMTSEERVVAERAFTVTKDAIDAARHLRADAGMAF